jgi:hypothetical protein
MYCHALIAIRLLPSAQLVSAGIITLNLQSRHFRSSDEAELRGDLRPDDRPSKVESLINRVKALFCDQPIPI